MDTRATQSSGLNAKLTTVIKVGILANIFEWYEFSIFGLLATHVSHLFFPSDLPHIGLIKTFGLFAASYFARPLGSIFFGLLSDRISRKAALSASLLLMAIPTLLIGFLPDFSQLGVIASASLILLRLLQGFAAGGELSASVCYIFEASLISFSRSLTCVSVSMGQTLGILLSSLVIACVSWAVSVETFEAWAWRIPFWCSIPLSLFIFWMRQSIEEIPVKKVKSFEDASEKVSIKKALRVIWYPVIRGILILSFLIGSYYIVAFWMPTYLIHFVHVPSHIARLTNAITLAMIVVFYGIMGYLSERFGYERVIAKCMSTGFILILPVFWILTSATSFAALLGAQLLLAFFMSATGLMTEMLGHSFPAKYRNIGISLTLTVPATLIGGITPLVCSYGIQHTGDLYFPAYYLMGLGFIALPFAHHLKDSVEGRMY